MTKTSHEWLTQSRQVGIVAMFAAGFGAALWLGSRTFDMPGLAGLATGSKALTTGERELGRFQEGNESVPGVTLVVDMTVYADVGDPDDGEFHQIVKHHGGEIRSAVSHTLRSARYADLMEPTLTTLKRKMKVALAAAAGEETRVFDQLLIPDYDVRQMN